MVVEVKYGTYLGKHDLVVVKGNGTSLLGRDWLRHTSLDWASIRAVSMEEGKVAVEGLIEKYSKVFERSPGQLKVHLTLQDGAIPPFCHPRLIKDSVGQELDCVGVLRKVAHATNCTCTKKRWDHTYMR